MIKKGLFILVGLMLVIGSTVTAEDKKIDVSTINIAGELDMRNRTNMEKEGANPGFQYYELELYIDSAVHDNVSVYMEYNLVHETSPEPEDVWVDIHKPGELAATGGTGLKIGNFHAPFGWDNDDNDGYVYGSRTTTNVPLIKSERIDGWRTRERQIGVQGNYQYEVNKDITIIPSLGIFNGNGSWKNYGGSDNDRRYDFAGKVEFRGYKTVAGLSMWNAPRTGRPLTGAYTQANNTRHLRDITRTAIYFKYPNVPFPAADLTLGNSRYLVWGEYMFGKHSKSPWKNTDQETFGYYLEGDVALPEVTKDFLAFLRYDFYEPDKGKDTNTTGKITNAAGKSVTDEGTGITPGVRWGFWKTSQLITSYEYYKGGANDLNDRFTVELKVFF